MTWPWQRWRRAQEADRQAYLSAIKSMEAVATAQSAAHAAMAQAMTAYLTLFKVDQPPTSRVIRDEDEYQAELVRLGFTPGATAFPYAHLTPPDQLRHVLEMDEADE